MRQQNNFSWIGVIGLAMTIVILWFSFDYIVSIKG